MELRKFLGIVTIAMIILMLTGIWFYPSNEDFRTDNPFWNGANNLSSSCPVQSLQSLSDLPSSPEGTTLIMVPYLEYTSGELEKLESYIAKGGTLVLADDYGHGNQILESFGLTMRFAGQTLLDPLINYKNKMFPRIADLKPQTILGNTENLVLNHATALVNVSSADTLAQSSHFSFLDQNENGNWEEEETTGPLPVISIHNFGSGRILLLADPSLLINSMMEMEGNRSLLQSITATAARIYIDQSHLPHTELHQVKQQFKQIINFLSTPVTTIILIIFALLICLRPIWSSRKNNIKL